jgi:transposase
VQTNSKKKTYTAVERDSEINKEKRKTFETELAKIPEENRVYIDETGTNLNMSRTHARSPVNTRAEVKRCGRQASNISLVGAIRLNEKPILYPYDGPVDGERFISYLTEKVIPTLKKGDVVIMDNLRVHHIEQVAVVLKPVGAGVLYLPPYSPELNPIEEMWSFTKSIFKSMESRTISAYIDTMNKVTELVTAKKIKGYFGHAESFLYNRNSVVNATG